VKITFVNTRIDIYPPFGLCYLSSYLKANCNDVQSTLVELIFGGSKEEAIHKILATGPDIVGFTTYTVGYHEIQEYCRLLRRAAPDLIIWLGGPHITSLPQSLPESADVGVIGEGEETAAVLYRVYSDRRQVSSLSLSGINGICYRDESGNICISPSRGYISELDTIPPPDLSILNMRWYTARRMFFTMKGNLKGFVLLSSRGCPFNCRFCQASAQWGRCRYHSAERVVSELEQIRKQYPHVNAVNIIDDLFIGDRKRLREIVRLIHERGLHHGLVFNVNGHANIIDNEVIELLKSINVVQIAYGFESGSDRMLNFLKRGSATVERNRRAAELTNAAGIGVGGQFMIGSPSETEEEIQQTINFILKTPMSHVHVSATTPMPGTELWDICRSKGLVSDEMDWSTLDFGNPDSTNILYCNEESIKYQRFMELKEEVKRASDRWNPVPSFIANLSYWQLYHPMEFFRRVFMGLNRMQRQFCNKIKIKIKFRSSKRWL